MTKFATALLAIGPVLLLTACERQGAEDAAADNVSTADAVADAGSTEGIVAPNTRPADGVEFNSVLALNQDPPPGQPQLRGGVVANSKEWHASLYATFATPRGTAACTAALVGPQAILTAAHCVPAGGRISINFGDRAYAAACKVHPRYGGGQDDSADFALCKVERPVAIPAGFKFETISTAPLDQLAQQRLVLGGFGCISDAVANAQTDGLYRIGYNTVDETSNSQTKKRQAQFYRPREVNNLLTRDDPGVANLCPGDSGGPAFRASATGAGPFSSRRIVGVNSRVFYRDANQTTYGASLVSATGGPDFPTWASGWAQQGQVALCGVRGGLPNCRTGP